MITKVYTNAKYFLQLVSCQNKNIYRGTKSKNNTANCIKSCLLDFYPSVWPTQTLILQFVHFLLFLFSLKLGQAFLAKAIKKVKICFTF